MRIFITTLLLIFIPLQASFAAAAAYCNLETTTIETHFGHHAHADSPSAEEDPEGTKKLNSECGICHFGCAQAQLTMTQDLPSLAAQPSLSGPDDPELDHFSETNDRPPRHALA